MPFNQLFELAAMMFHSNAYKEKPNVEREGHHV